MLNPKALCQLELHSEKIDASLAFFEAVFGWKVVPIMLHEYVVLEVPDDSPYGISVVAATDKNLSRQTVVPYFRWNEGLELLLETTKSHGGRVVWGPRLVPAYGELYLIEEPGGIRLGFFRSQGDGPRSDRLPPKPS